MLCHLVYLQLEVFPALFFMLKTIVQKKLEEEESSALREQLLPLIIGLLRTVSNMMFTSIVSLLLLLLVSEFIYLFFSYQAKLSSVLRDYRDGLVAGIITAIKSTAARFLASQSFDSDIAERHVEADGMN